MHPVPCGEPALTTGKRAHRAASCLRMHTPALCSNAFHSFCTLVSGYDARHPSALLAPCNSCNRRPPADLLCNRLAVSSTAPVNPTLARPGAAGAAALAPRSPTPRWTRRPCSSPRPPSQARPAGASPAQVIFAISPKLKTRTPPIPARQGTASPAQSG